MKKCVLKGEFEKGFRIYYYQPLNSNDPQLNQEYVKIYVNEEKTRTSDDLP